MAKYRKKPIVIEAEVYRPGMEDGFDCCDNLTCSIFRNFHWTCDTCGYGRPYINTFEGQMYITEGDYIVTGVLGERYPCKSEIFYMTYEEVEE